MDIKFAFICEHATSENGKHSIIGISEKCYIYELEAEIPYFTVAVGIETGRNEAVSIMAKIVDKNGKTIAKEGIEKIMLPKEKEKNMEVYRLLFLNVKFKPGKYEVKIFLGNKNKVSYSLPLEISYKNLNKVLLN